MQITEQMLTARLELLQQERLQAISAVGAYDGAISQLNWDLAQLKTVEPVAEVNAQTQDKANG